MGKFTNSFSSEDFEIIRNVAISFDGRPTPDELRARIVGIATELQPERLLSDDMVDALVKSCSKANI